MPPSIGHPAGGPTALASAADRGAPFSGHARGRLPVHAGATASTPRLVFTLCGNREWSCARGTPITGLHVSDPRLWRFTPAPIAFDVLVRRAQRRPIEAGDRGGSGAATNSRLPSKQACSDGIDAEMLACPGGRPRAERRTIHPGRRPVYELQACNDVDAAWAPGGARYRPRWLPSRRGGSGTAVFARSTARGWKPKRPSPGIVAPRCDNSGLT